eukprot:2742789-Pleurochrysis_carterae.AAC.1
MRMSTTTQARPPVSHHTKHCVHQSARCTGQNLYADSASATQATARVRRSPLAARAPASSMMAKARASCCTFGRTT